MTAELLPAHAALLLDEIRPGRRVSACLPRTGGQLSQVYEARFTDGTAPVIIKLYTEAWQWKQAKEAYVYQLLDGRLSVAIPRIMHVGRAPEELGGLGCTVMTRLPGRPLSAISDDLNDADSFRVYRQMGAILAELHRIRQDGFGYLTTTILDPKPTNTAYMTSQFTTKLREFADLGGDPGLGTAIGAHVAERTTLFAACGHAALCHNDFHEGNILVDRDKSGGWAVTGFVDVENAIAADPLIDLAKTDCYSIRGHRAKLDGLMAGYGLSPDPALADRLAIYRLYHALELWDWFASIGQAQRLDGLISDMRTLISDAL